MSRMNGQNVNVVEKIGRVTKLNSTYLCLCFVFLSQVNGQNVVKVGHRQVVNMIRQGGNSLMVKVVMVTRNPDMDEGTRKKSKSISCALGQWQL